MKLTRVVGLLLCIHSVMMPFPSVVFIHLGPEIPAHLFDATKQARLFNDTDVRIIVIAEQQAINGIDPLLIERDQIEMVACEVLQESQLHNLFKRISRLDRHAHGGLWFASAERFFYLDKLIRQYNLYDVCHLEYDNMLYVELKELMPVFHKYANIAATFDADDRCIAGFVYFAQPNSVMPLIESFVQTVDRRMFEMHAIAFFKNMQDAEVIDHLPVIMPEYTTQFGLHSLIGRTTAYPQRYMQYIEEFNSIFDAAAWGQYLGGVSPRNDNPMPGFVNETALFNPSKLHIQWHVDSKGRLVPYVYAGEKGYRINNLHIHSKNLQAFAS